MAFSLQSKLVEEVRRMFGMDMTMHLAPLAWAIIALAAVSAASVLAAHDHRT